MPIREFKDEYRFLSNFWPYQGKELLGPPAPILWKDVTYATAEHLYQCAKANNPFDRQRIITAETPGLAKRIGGDVQLRPDWEQIKHEVMLKTVRAKFQQNPDLAGKLLATGNEELVEGNWHGDGHWGYDLKTSHGENWLGRILMIVRAELRFRRELQGIVNDMRMGRLHVESCFVTEDAA